VSGSRPIPTGWLRRSRTLAHVDLRQGDFLTSEGLDLGPVDFVVGNPPYVPIEGLTEAEKTRYRAAFDTAAGRFDLYLLFFERSLALLGEGGRLVFVTPEKFEYVDTAEPLRRLLTADDRHVERIEHLSEDTFDGRVAFPCVTTVQRGGSGSTAVQLRDGVERDVTLPGNGSSWAPSVRGYETETTRARRLATSPSASRQAWRPVRTRCSSRRARKCRDSSSRTGPDRPSPDAS
jgi:hypothetical protein